MAQPNLNLASTSSGSSSRPGSSDPLQPGTFRSLLPVLDEILGVLYEQSVGDRVSPAQAAEQVAPKAKELAKAIQVMKNAALNLPGGHLSTEEIRRLSEMLDEEGEKRRRILRAFEGRDMPVTEGLGDKTLEGVEGGSSVPTPGGQ